MSAMRASSATHVDAALVPMINSLPLPLDSQLDSPHAPSDRLHPNPRQPVGRNHQCGRRCWHRRRPAAGSHPPQPQQPPQEQQRGPPGSSSSRPRRAVASAGRCGCGWGRRRGRQQGRARSMCGAALLLPRRSGMYVSNYVYGCSFRTHHHDKAAYASPRATHSARRGLAAAAAAGGAGGSGSEDPHPHFKLVLPDMGVRDCVSMCVCALLVV